MPVSCAGSSTLSATVRSSSRLKNWKIMPIRSLRKRASPVSLSESIRCPATVTVPLVGRSRPAIRFSSVDLPLPDGPMTATDSPAATSKLTPSTAKAPALSYCLLTSLTSISVFIGLQSLSGVFAFSARARQREPRDQPVWLRTPRRVIGEVTQLRPEPARCDSGSGRSELPAGPPARQLKEQDRSRGCQVQRLGGAHHRDPHV